MTTPVGCPLGWQIGSFFMLSAIKTGSLQAWENRRTDKLSWKGEREYASDKNHIPCRILVPNIHQLTDKQLYDEINYHRVEKLMKKYLHCAVCGLLLTPHIQGNQKMVWICSVAI